MIIPITIVTTCVVLICINIYMAINDAKSKRKLFNEIEWKLKNLYEDCYNNNTDIELLKNRIDTILSEMINLKTFTSSSAMNVSECQLKLMDVETKLNLALLSINTLQSDMLKSIDTNE